MLSEKEIALIYETLLSSPGMNDVVKVDIRIPRKSVLLLVKAIERGMSDAPKELNDSLIKVAGNNSIEVLQQINNDLLQKAGLSELNEKLLSLKPVSK